MPATPLSDRNASTWLTVWVIGCTLGALGPYVAAGLRTEQILIYGSALGIALTRLTQLPRIVRPAATVLAMWTCYLAAALVSAVLVNNATSWPTGSLTAGVDNAALPLATLVTVTFWTTLRSARDLLALVAWTITLAMSANALLAVCTAILGPHNVSFLGVFWTSGGADGSVAVAAAGNGRFSGVFNQPAEAGIAYSLALLLVIFLFRTRGDTRRAVLTVLFVLVIVGGLLTISKIFVLGGLVVGLLLALTDRVNRLWVSAVGIATVVAMTIAGFLGLTGSWGLTNMLDWYSASIDRGDSFLYTLSAGRFGTGGGIAPTTPTTPTEPTGIPVGGAGRVASEILDHHPWLGVSARGLQVAYDSTWIEALVVGGLVGLAIMAAIHVLLVLRWMSIRTTCDPATWYFAGAVVLLVIGSSFGMPALTGNRESTLLWICVGLLLFAHPAPWARDAGPVTAPAPESLTTPAKQSPDVAR